jgi:hypothetical protein
VAHTWLFSSYFDYPYPKAVSVSAEDQEWNTPICWNYGRPDEKELASVQKME